MNDAIIALPFALLFLAFLSSFRRFHAKLFNPRDDYFWGDRKWSWEIERNMYRRILRVYRGPAQVFAIGFTLRDGPGVNLMIVWHFQEDCTGGLKGSNARHIPLFVRWKYPMSRVRSFFYSLQGRLVHGWLFAETKKQNAA